MSATSSALEFSYIRAAEVSKYQELRLRITLDGCVQESLESTLDAGVHTWREPFCFTANSLSQCEIHVLAKKRKFFCCTGRFKIIRTTHLQNVGKLLDERSSDGVVQLPLYGSTKTDANGAALGSVVFSIADTSVMSDSLKLLPTRDMYSVSYREDSCAASLQSPYAEAVPEKLSWVDMESDAPSSPPPRPMAPTPPASPPSVSPILCPHNVPPRPNVLAPQYLQTSSRLPQSSFACPPQKSGVDRIPAKAPTYGDAAMRPEYVLAPGILSDDTMTAASSLVDETGFASQGPAETGSFSPVICEPPEDIASEEMEMWLPPPHTTEPTYFPTPSDALDHGTVPRISITLAKSSRGNSPLPPSSCDSDVTVKRPSVHVDTGSATQATGPGDELSPFSCSDVLASLQPTPSTSNSSGLSPFSRTSMSTAATTPAHSAASDGPKDDLTSVPGSNAKQRKERPTIDTSCVGPRGQVKKYRNGSVPPVHVPTKLRNASLDLPRCHEHEKFEPNPSMYSIAPSISPRHLKKSGDLRCSSTQVPASRQGLAPSTRTRAPSIRREPLEFDEAQICLDTANLGDQEVATFLKEVDAALSAIVNGSPAVAADSRAFLAVPSATSRIVSRHQSRRPSSQQLRADLSATIRSHESAARTGFSLVATSHPAPHPDVISSRVASPLTDGIPRLVLSQPGSPHSAVLATGLPLSQRVSPQPSPRQELVEWVSARTKEHS